MKKTFNNFRTLAALLMAGAAFAACSSDDNIIENQQPANPGEQVYTLTINASKGDGTTRALDLDGTGKLTASWTNGDELTVVNQTKSYTALGGTLTASNASGNTAAFSGALTGTIEVGDKLMLYYHQINGVSSFSNQDGTLKGTNGAEKYDVAWAVVTVASVNAGEITIVEPYADFYTVVAMLKLTLQDGSSNPLNPTSLTISVDGFGDLLTLSPTAATYAANGDGILYLAMPTVMGLGDDPALATATVTFTATVGGNTYTTTKTGYKFADGKYYAATLTMAEAAPALNLTSPAVGQVIGDDGKNYNYASLPGGVTAVAKICYVDGSHGLALALADEGAMNWSTAITTCAAHTPAFTGGTWKLASKDEWDNMIIGAGSYTALRDGFSSVGGTNMGSPRYWSSTEYTYSESAWFYIFASGNWSNDNKNVTEIYARACLKF